MLPPESCMSPAMQLSAVDLPHPEGPSRQMNSPRLTVNDSSSSALNALPPAPANRRVTRSSLSSLKSCFMRDASLLTCRHPRAGGNPFCAPTTHLGSRVSLALTRDYATAVAPA